MKYLPLVWAGLARKPVHPILTAISMTCASCLAGLALAMARILPRSAELDLAVGAIAGVGFLLILLLTVHAEAQSVRERAWEFALLRVLGFPAPLVAGLFFLEIASACLFGAALGLAMSQILFFLACGLLFKGAVAPFLPPAVIWLDPAAAVGVAFASTVLPVWRLRQLNLAAVLAVP